MKYKIGFFLITFFFVFGILTGIYINTDMALADVPEKIIRLHVVANSDSPVDQQLKLQVRDRIISSMSGRLEGLKDISEVKSIVQGSLAEIEAAAREVIEENRKRYGVKAVFTEMDFPTRTYGNITLPAGTYQALNIVIGEGKGKNWWCVMFPPLCFIDVAHGIAAEETMKELKTSLTEEEYSLLVSAKEPGAVSVKLRFKIFELAKSMGLSLAKLGNL